MSGGAGPDIALVLPPFGLLEYPSLALHSLQAVAEQAGASARVVYGNLRFASLVGAAYEGLCGQNYFLHGERVFAKAAWGAAVGGQFPDGLCDYRAMYGRPDEPMRLFPMPEPVGLDALRAMEAAAGAWADAVAVELVELVELGCRVVGLSASYDQTNAAVAVLRRVKAARPEVVTLLGGYVAEGDGAEGVASLDPRGEVIDYVFSGEAEESFAGFVRDWREGRRPAGRVVRGRPLSSWEGVPPPRFDDYFAELARWLPDFPREKVNLVAESSRGCWWGQASHCLFCGYDERLGFRQKPAARVLEELEGLRRWGTKRVNMADLIMPRSHFDDLLPELARRGEGWEIYYEQRAAWDHGRLGQLKAAGVVEHQPGVESLSDRLLALMGKGNTLRQNLRFLRDATAAGLTLYWNMLWGFPGETAADYRVVNALVPLLGHLIPPIGMFRVALVKFSPLLAQRERFGITGVRPGPSYAQVFPPWADHAALANLFVGEYEAETFRDRGEIDRLEAGLEAWAEAWRSPLTRPRLQVARRGDGGWVLLDTRWPAEGVRVDELDPARLAALRDDAPWRGDAAQAWAVERRAAIRWRDRLVSLATVDPEAREEDRA